MAKSSIFQLLKPTGTTPRNGFSLDQRSKFTSKAGYELPILVLDYNPNERFDIQPFVGCQTFPLLTNSFGVVKSNISYFKVPYTVVWSRFDEMIATRNDIRSSALRSNQHVPCFNLGKLLKACMHLHAQWLAAAGSNLVDEAGFDQVYNDGFGGSQAMNTIRLLDMLGYGNYMSFLASTVTDQQKLNQSIDTAETIANDPWHYLFTQYPSLLRLGAYQAIWYQVYRNSVWDNPDSDAPYVNSFNFDDFDCSSVASADYFSQVAGDDETTVVFDKRSSPFILRFRQWKKDRFTGIYPSQQYGEVSYVTLSSVISGQFTGSDNGRWDNLAFEGDVVKETNARYLSLESNDAVRPLSHTHALPVINTSASLDVYALRKAELLQKWRETLLRTGNKTKDVFKGIFGTDYTPDPHHEIDYIGSCGSEIKIDPVIATANTASDVSSDTNLGDVAGRATMAIQGKTFRVNTGSKFGVIIGLMDLVPDAEYNALMIDRGVTRGVADDFFNPVFQNLGFEPLHFRDISNISVIANGDGTVSQVNPEDVVGYQPRFMDMKCAVDKVHGIFQSEYGSSNSDVNGNPSSDSGSLYPWALPRSLRDIARAYNSRNFFYVAPYATDNMFVKTFDGMQDSDPFMFTAFHQVRAVRPLSVAGLPQW